MNPRTTQMVERGRRLIAGFTPGQRAMVVVAALGLVLGAVALTRWVAQPTWTTLFSQMSPADASAVVDQLQAQNVQYQLVGGGTTVLVPQSQVYDLRLSLAGKGLPANEAGSGWSILDKQGLTATDFQQNVAYQRALEAELGNTLGAMTGVKLAIVHLAIPKKDVFSTQQDKTTASVLLQLTPGTAVSRAQVRSITQLVAGSVPGLNPSDVTLTDGAGNLLSTPADGAGGAAANANDADQQTALFEDRMTTKVQQMLDQVLGPNHAVVRVNAQLNYDATDTTSETYVSSPGVAPLSEATTVETYGGGAAPAGGQLGAISPTLSPVPGASGLGGYYKADQTVNNAVGKVVTNQKKAPGGVQRLNVAVILDSKTAGGANVATLQQLVSDAVGADKTRGDNVTVDKLPFDTTAAAASAKELAAAQSAAQTAQYIDLGKKAGLVLLAIVFGVIMMRRRKGDDASVTATARDLDGGLQSGILMPSRAEAIGSDRMPELGSRAASAPESALPDSVVERERLRDEVSTFVDSQPDDMAALVQGWLSQRNV